MDVRIERPVPQWSNEIPKSVFESIIKQDLECWKETNVIIKYLCLLCWLNFSILLLCTSVEYYQCVIYCALLL